MTDPPFQVWTRYIAIDIHKHYLMRSCLAARDQTARKVVRKCPRFPLDIATYR